MSKKRFISLNLKLTLVVGAALALAIALYAFSEWVENLVVENYYKSEAVIKRNITNAYEDLEDFIADNTVKGTDSEKLQRWLKENDYTYLTVSNNNMLVFDGGWSYTPSVSDKNKKDDNSVSSSNGSSGGITSVDGHFKKDLKNRIVKFSDGDYYVYVDVYKEERFQHIMLFAQVIACGTAAIACLLIYNSRVLNRMIRLSKEVQMVSDGDLDAEIDPTSNDEIGRLAVNVDNMRNAIVEKLQSEKAAWDANTQLITAMSHDIRTPLTSLIGYLDIIESQKYSSHEEMMKYIISSREKAFQLKDLSDKLFQYFLVFGSHEKEKDLETFNAGILLQQLISEHAAELISYGYKIDFEYAIPDVEIRADISGLKRLFDNIASNVMKYADKKYHIRISAVLEEKDIIVRVINRVSPLARKVESNKIGLKTCEKICHDMAGRFIYKDEGQMFTVRISLPTSGEIKENGQEDEQ